MTMHLAILGFVIITAATYTAPGYSNAGDCGIVRCGVGGGGTDTSLTANETKDLPRHTKITITKHGKKHTKRVPYQYRTRTSCKDKGLGGKFCAPNYGACLPMPDANGPLVNIDRRTVLPDHEHGPWHYVATTCYPDLVPNTKDRPRLTIAMIKNAWSHTSFAKPEVSIQPVGHRTLVTLPTYFELTWPTNGYEPGEVRTVRLLGHRVRIKPTFKHNVFHFGDGTTSGPTESSGGPYPSGDVTHSYDRSGTYATHISTVYGGQFSVDGADWADIPGTITIQGPSQQLEVLTAKNRLVTQ